MSNTAGQQSAQEQNMKKVEEYKHHILLLQTNIRLAKKMIDDNLPTTNIEELKQFVAVWRFSVEATLNIINKMINNPDN